MLLFQACPILLTTTILNQHIKRTAALRECQLLQSYCPMKGYQRRSKSDRRSTPMGTSKSRGAPLHSGSVGTLLVPPIFANFSSYLPTYIVYSLLWSQRCRPQMRCSPKFWRGLMPYSSHSRLSKQRYVRKRYSDRRLNKMYHLSSMA
jgi:hypothetical protein